MSTHLSDPEVTQDRREPAPLSTGESSPADAPERRERGFFRRLDWRVVLLVLAALVAVPIWRAVTTEAKAHETNSQLKTAQPVAVVRVARENLSQQLACDAELRPYQEIDLHAKVSGFLQSIDVDIGDHVNAKQLLARIEIPELQDDIAAATANLKRSEEEVSRAQAAYEAAHLVSSRLIAANRSAPNLIAQQQLDEAESKERSAAADLGGAEAQVDVTRAGLSKLRTMLSYSEITAPFPGIITKRYADPGALIQSATSSSTQSLPLVRLSENDRLRLDIPVSVSYVSRVVVGDPVEVRVDALNKTFTGKISRTTDRIETATRTMMVEVDVPNPDLQLIPGMYASVLLRVQHRENALAVPVEAVSRQKKRSTVMVVDKNSEVEERTVTLGLETPYEVEVLSGLKENDLVLVGSHGEISAGQPVEPKLIAKSAE